MTRDILDRVFTSSAINKAASLVTNQKGCRDSFELTWRDRRELLAKKIPIFLEQIKEAKRGRDKKSLESILASYRQTIASLEELNKERPLRDHYTARNYISAAVQNLFGKEQWSRVVKEADRLAQVDKERNT